MMSLPFVFFVGLLHFSVFSLCTAVDSISPTQSISGSYTLVSPGGRFELGLFSKGNSKAWYLGIWYKNLTDIVVWVANRENPVTSSDGVLKLTNNGSLVLLDKMNKTVWSPSSSSFVEDPVAQLLETGNFVVRDKAMAGSESYVWQSFDFPSDTLLAGMKLGWDFRTGLNKFLTSWKNSSDPSLGEYTYGIVNRSLPQLVLAKGSDKEFRTGPWNGLWFNGFPAPKNNETISASYVYDTNELYYTYQTNDNSLITRLQLTEGGDLKRLVLNEEGTEWNDMYDVLNDRCDNYAECGANGICKISDSPICDCLEGFVPTSQQEWELLNRKSGCTRKIQLDCQKGEGFRKLQNVKLPDLLDFGINNSLDNKECRAECLKSCSCVAYSYYSPGGTGCLMWFKDLIDIREFVDESEQHFYIRMPASELGHANQKEKRVVLIVVISAACVLTLLGMSGWLITWKKKGKQGSRLNEEDMELPLFDFHTIAAGTNNFSRKNILGEGGFGPVYKAYLAQGQIVAVKRLSKDSRQGTDEFKNEVTMITNLQHRNLVKLLGCCIEGQEKMLIYEFMPNKSLDSFIFDENRRKLLDWQKRVDIIIGIARGLLYLHQDSRLRIIHRDLKSGNILLDNELNPKISDFGVARIFGLDQTEAKTKRVIGTYGYMSPEYAIDGNFSVKSDVFSFGVLLLEIVSGRTNRRFHHPDHHHSLLGHAWLLWNKEKGLELLDPCLEDSYVLFEVLRCIHVGLLCVHKLSIDRPDMSSVVFMLSNEGATLPEPKEPGFFTERSSTDGVNFISEGRSKTGDVITITTMEAR